MKELSVIKSINEDGNITEHCLYSLSPDKALVCYLEQTINKNYNTSTYWEDFIDKIGNIHPTKSKFIDMIKPLPSGKGYGIDFGEKIVCAYRKF